MSSQTSANETEPKSEPLNESQRERESDERTRVESEVANRVDEKEDEKDDGKDKAALNDLMKAKTAAPCDVPDVALGTVQTITRAATEGFRLHNFMALGPAKFFNPTHVRARIKWGHGQDDPVTDEAGQLQPAISRAGLPMEETIRWHSRDQRKGRNSVVSDRPHNYVPRIMFTTSQVSKGLWRMCTTIPYWDMAFWSGWSYTVGSVLFVLDGFFAWLPIAFPWTEFAGESKWVVPFLFFVGAWLYQFGATIAYLETINDGSFQGSAMNRFLEGHEEHQKSMLDEKILRFVGRLKPHRAIRHHRLKKKEERQQNENVEESQRHSDLEAAVQEVRDAGELGNGSLRNSLEADRRGGVDHGPAEEEHIRAYPRWRWWPTWERFKTHHIRDIGFIACCIQFFGAILFVIDGIVVLPGILSSLSQWQENVAYWVPEIAGSTCFLVAGLMFILETQEKWYKPEPELIGWWIGVWASIGSCGFLICGVLGPASANSRAEYQSELSSTWGSFAYLISGFLQWYEAVNKGDISSYPAYHLRDDSE